MRGCPHLLRLLLVLLSVASATERTVEETCFQERPGTANRQEITLKVADRDWLTHDLIGYIADIVLKEFLGYTVVHVVPSAGSSLWGSQMVTEEIDMDLEQWQASESTTAYAQYITTERAVLDAGPIGYSGRSGLFTQTSALTRNIMVDWYAYYQNATLIQQDQFYTWPESGLAARLGDEFPLCDPAVHQTWCGSGEFLGYWVPTQCVQDPAKCVEIVAASPAWDTSYFEQIVRNNGVLGIFGYYGGGNLGAHVKELAATGRPVVFYWYEPDPLLLQVDAVRISFPDNYYGCARLNNKNADTGKVACDYGESQLKKLVSRRVLDNAPEAYYFLSRLEVLAPQITDVMLRAEGGGGPNTTFGASCEFIRQNMNLIRSFAPTCITDPPIKVQNGDQVFNAQIMECQNATILFPQDPLQCTLPASVSTADRTDQTIRIVRREWLTHDLVSMVTEVVLRDFLGYTVEAVLNNLSATSRWGEDMITDDLYDVDMENWQVSEGAASYQQFILTDQVVILGNIGFPGRSGLYVTREALERAPFASFYKFFWNASTAISKGFVPHADATPITTSSCTDSWCGTDALEGFWATQNCRADPGQCVSIVHITPRYDTSYLEQILENNGIAAVVGYYGDNTPNSYAVLLSYTGTAKFTPFYHWEPDGFLTQVDAVRVSFPDNFFGCASPNTLNPNTGTIACDFAEVSPKKLAKATILSSMPEAYYTLEYLQVFRDSIDAMLAQHVSAGGSFTTEELVCNWITSNNETLADWAPSCITHPLAFEDVVGTSIVFDPEELRCGLVKQCPNNTVLRFLNIFYCDPCGAGQVPNDVQSECRSCGIGLEVSSDGSECVPCVPGTAKAADADACAACPEGRYASSPGQSACAFCNSTHYFDGIGGADCKPCGAVIRGSVTPFLGATSPDQCECGAGFYLPLSGDACVACLEGMTCEAGASMLNLPGSHNPGASGPYPAVAYGYMTRVEEPLTVYLCSEKDHCPGGAPGTCAVRRNTETIGCAECQDGAYESSGECKRCGEMDWVPTIGAIIVCIIAACCCVVAANKNVLMKSSQALLWMVIGGLVMTSLQTLMIFRRMSVEWFDPLSSIFDALSIVSFNLDIVRLACVVGSGRVRGYLASQMIAPMSVPVLFLLLLLKKRYWKPHTKVPLELVNSVGTIFNVFFISIVISAVGPHVCYLHPGDSGKSVVSEPSVLCDFTGEHLMIVIIGMTASLLVPLPFVVLITYGVISYRKKKKSGGGSDDFLLAFRFLFIRFNTPAYWFGLVVAARSLLMCLTPVMFGDSALQVVVLSLILCSYILAQQTVKPWRSKLANFIDLAMTLGLLLLLLCISVVTVFTGGVDAVKVAAVIGLLGTAITPGAVAVAVYHANWKASHFEVFVCHHKAGAGAQARLMKMLLVSKIQRNVFIDSDNLVELDGLFDIVKTKVKLLLVYMTREVLTRPWCVGEIATSYECKKMVVTVQTESWETPHGDAIDELPNLIDKKGMNLQEQGISEEVVAKSLRRVVSDEQPTIMMDNTLLGSLKFMRVAGQVAEVLGHSRKGKHKNNGHKSDGHTDGGPPTIGKLLSDASIVSGGAAPKAKKLHVDHGGVLAVADSQDDEAVAAMSILTQKINSEVMSFVGSRLVDTAEYPENEFEDALKGVEHARAVVILLSRRSLELYSQVSVIHLGMTLHVTMIPVNVWDFNFPSNSYYETALPKMWPAEVQATAPLKEVQASMRAFFKLITVFLATMASDQVLTTQADDVVARIPRDWEDKNKLRADSKGSNVTAASLAAGGRFSQSGKGDRTKLNLLAAMNNGEKTEESTQQSKETEDDENERNLSKLQSVNEADDSCTAAAAAAAAAATSLFDNTSSKREDREDIKGNGYYPVVNHFKDARGVKYVQIDFS